MPSLIDGTLQISNTTSNLFLINPAGITFGANAQLRLPGSFIAASAESAQFENGFIFDVSTANSPPLMTVSAPIGLQMGTGEIAVNNTGHNLTTFNPITGQSGSAFLPYAQQGSSNGLQVFPGKTLALLGNGIDLNGGVVTANSGHVEIGSVSEGSVVNLVPTPLGFAAAYTQATNPISFQDITFSNRALANVSGVPTPLPPPLDSIQTFATPQGTLQVTGQNITLTEASMLLGQTGIAATQPGGDIHVTAAGKLTISGSEGLTNLRSGIFSETLGSSKSGAINVNAEQLQIQAGAGIGGTTFTNANSGDITITTDDLMITGFNPINPGLSSGIATFSAGGTGISGNVEVKEASSIVLLDGGSISSVNAGQGQAGNLIISADDIMLSGRIAASDIPSSFTASNFGNGVAGNITVNSQRLTIQDQAVIAASSISDGPAGNITITARERIDIQEPITSNRASLAINSAVLLPTVLERAFFNIPPSYVLPSGDAGNIEIRTPQLSLTGPVSINVQNTGSGDGGQASIFADSAVLRGGSQIRALTLNGEGGDVNLQLRESLVLRENSQINAESGGTGNGGNITVVAPIIVALENSDIIANAIQGMGGNINITSQGILGTASRDRLTPESDITASSELGINGTVEINTPQTSPSASAIALPTTPLNSTQQVARSCTDSVSNHFVASGRGGIPENPSGILLNTGFWQDVRPLHMQTVSTTDLQPPTPPQAQATPLEATHWNRTANGDIQLIDGNLITAQLTACIEGPQQRASEGEPPRYRITFTKGSNLLTKSGRVTNDGKG